MLDEGSLIWAPSDSDGVIRSGRARLSPSPRSPSRSPARTPHRSGRSGRSGSRSHARSRSRDRSRSCERRARCPRSRDRGGCDRDRESGGGDRDRRKKERREQRDDSSNSERDRPKKREKRKETGPSPMETAVQPRQPLEPAQQELSVEDAVSRQIDACDPRRTLPGADFHHVLTEVTNIVLGVMIGGARTALDEEDRDFIRTRVRTMVRPGPGASEAMMVTEPDGQSGSEQVSTPFQRFDQVVCRLDGERKWFGGVVHECLPPAVNEDSALEDDGQSMPRYVHVVVDPPDNGLIAVLEHDCHLQRTAGCDGVVCRRIMASTDSSDRAMGLKRKVTHLLTYLGRVVAV